MKIFLLKLLGKFGIYAGQNVSILKILHFREVFARLRYGSYGKTLLSRHSRCVYMNDDLEFTRD